MKCFLRVLMAVVMTVSLGCEQEKPASSKTRSAEKTGARTAESNSAERSKKAPRNAAALVQALVAESGGRGRPLGRNERLGEPGPRLAAVLDALACDRSGELPGALLTVVRTGDDRAAAWACEALARRADSEAAPALWERLLRPDCPHPLERQIHSAFGRIDRTAAAVFLTARAQDPDWQKRQTALQLMVSAPSPIALPVLLDALADGVTAVRGSAVEALVRIGPPALPGLVESAADPRGAAAAPALEALARIGDPRAARAVTAVLTGPDLFGQSNARMAFEKALNPSRETTWYLEAAAPWEHPEAQPEKVRQAAFDALSAALPSAPAKIRPQITALLGSTGARAVPLLRRLAQSDHDSTVKAVASRQLGAVAGREAMPTLIQALQSASPNARDGAVGALLPLVGDGDLAALAPALNHASPAVRACALRLLRQMRSPEARELLHERITASDPDEAGDALYSLSRMPCEADDLPSLQDAGRSEHRGVRSSAARILGRHNSPDARAILIAMTAHADIETGKAAEKALGATDDPRAFRPLIALDARRCRDGINQGISPALRPQAETRWPEVLPILGDADPGRRAVAAAVLAYIRVPEVREELSQRMINREREIVLNAAGGFQDGTNRAVEDVLVDWMDNRSPAGCLASEFLNSSNPRLRSAAVSWYLRHGYTVLPCISVVQ